MMFDVPVKEDIDRRVYSHFRKWLTMNGYMRYQKSVYVKLLRNISAGEGEVQKLRAASPERGTVSATIMNLDAFRHIQTLHGDRFDIGFFSDDVVFLGEDSH